jgi:carbon-monoxide dehydrogenase medium subunit
MYPAAFEYHAPSTVAEALALLDQHKDDAKIIAGSQSLVPLMKLRLAEPKHVVDLRKLPGLAGVSEAGEFLQIGAFTTHRAIETSEIVRSRIPMMSEAAGLIGDAQVRNMGTIGGSLAHADPGADWPAVTSALDARVQIVSKKGERSLKIEELIQGPLTTVLQPGEIITQVRVPLPGAGVGSAYEKWPHPASRFAIVGVAAVLTVDRGNVQSARVVISGLGPKIARAAAVEKAVQGKAADAAAFKAAAAHAAEGIQVRDDANGSAAYKKNLVAVVAERALTRAAGRVRKG